MSRRKRGPWATRLGVGLASIVGSFAVVANLATAVAVLTGRFLIVSGGADPGLTLEQLPQLIQADERPGHTFTVADLAPQLRVLCAGPSIVAAATILAAVLLLIRALDEIAAGRAFEPPSRRLLGWLSAVLIGGGILQGLLDTAAIAALVASVDYEAIEGLGTNVPRWPWTLIVVGVVVSALSLAFAEGARLKEDVAGVV
ncbi:DUF2975 domain-containing protein [Actinotalea sp. M2MS4P-6]|uniref:DUF2975 domain-containing protein n=1 Tax=Actinotalea sp. M2MS4P-6 TaxID=2983762 RepID=UPI0021E48169|nr:DUF2975 domain-containing protein [Actinotalea sp. M2MS4P-6]MCV2394718.1 DUF2975 domain-containing protein [Actinotalea sp. M2MS4P-6]